MSKVAVIGIHGVGKEYVRELVTDPSHHGKLVALVDFQEVLDREVMFGTATHGPLLTNEYPGHNFTVEVPEGVETVPNDDESHVWIRTLVRLGVTHAIVATPPLEKARDFIYALVAEGIQVLVEKPLDAEMPKREDQTLVSVGYMFALTYRHDAYYEARIIVPRPEDNSWRWNTGRNPILWDVAVHLLSLDMTEALKDVLLTDEMFLATTVSGVRYVAAYVSNQDEARYGVFLLSNRGRTPMDWEVNFKRQLTRFLSDTPRHEDSWRVAQKIETFARLLEANYGG